MSPKADDPKMIEALQRFIDASANDAGFEPPFTEADRDLILSLTGVAAHTVVRPAGDNLPALEEALRRCHGHR